MEKRIPIDDLFHDKLSRGKEQLNLGAWANMERLLDGQNPYTEEEKKKRRILPLFLLLLIGAATFTAGYIVKQTYYPSAAESQGIAKVASKNQKAMDATLSSMQVDETDAKNTNADHSLMAANKEESTTVSNQAKLNDTKYNSSHLQTSNHTNQQDLIKSSTTGVTSNRASKNSKKQGVAQNTTSIGAGENKLSSANASNNDNLKIQKETNKNFAKSSTTQNQMQDRLNNSSVTNSIIETKTMPMVEINQKAEYNKNGTVKKYSSDTVLKSTISQQYETVLQTKPETLASIDYHISNPRYVDLSSEAELKANEQTDLNSKKEETSSAAEESSKVQNQVLATTNSISKKRSSSNQTSYFEDLKRFSSDTYQKLVNAVKFGAHPDTYTGLSMGMNASLSSAQNNFGGFHAGLTNLKPVSDYFSVLTEFKFFYRNNGGYTVNDIYTRTLNRWTDNSSLTHQTIYNYQMDSTVRTYNFKNFYSLELPIMMQLNYRSFAIYGGANLAYNFKLNVNEKTRNYVIDKHDTMSNSYVYSFPADKGSQLQRSDFSSRFGLGYTMGASYQFSPQLYVDVRMSQNVWDNMKTNAAREISNGFFKVPNVQFSLGYRFRKFVPDN